MASPALSNADWERLGAFPARDEDENDRPQSAACEACESLSAELAKANALLKTIRRLEPRAPKRETLDDSPETLEALGHAVYVATIKTRIDLFLASNGRRS